MPHCGTHASLLSHTYGSAARATAPALVEVRLCPLRAAAHWPSLSAWPFLPTDFPSAPVSLCWRISSLACACSQPCAPPAASSGYCRATTTRKPCRASRARHREWRRVRLTARTQRRLDAKKTTAIASRRSVLFLFFLLLQRREANMRPIVQPPCGAAHATPPAPPMSAQCVSPGATTALTPTQGRTR